MTIFDALEIPDNVQLGDVKHMLSLSDTLATAGVIHGLAILGDGISNHACENIDPDNEIDRLIMDKAPKYNEQQVQVYLAYEQAMMSSFFNMRASLRYQGYPVDNEVPASHN